MMFKIGTGAGDRTIPGKIYLEKPAERDGEIAWTYCQGKLFSRRVSEDFGLISLFDAETLAFIGEAKLLCGDIFSGSGCPTANRFYPIMSDGQSIFIVTMKITKKRRHQ